MNCEKAEGYLSAYLDDMLDPQLRREVEVHIDGCARCHEVLADYRRFDHMLTVVPRVTPTEDLRARIFESPDFAALMRRLDRESDAGRGGLATISRPTTTASAEPTASPGRTFSRGSPPTWARIALQVAAVFVLLLGSALLFKQGLLHSGTPTSHETPLTIGNPGQSGVPLAAGPRAVYLRDGQLWSAPESGPGVAQVLTPAGVTVAGWNISPDGRALVYIDAQTGRIHTVRSDGQSDQVIANATAGTPSAAFWSSGAGQLVQGALAWSPDGTQIAYIAARGTGTTALHVMNADGTNDRTVDTGASGLVAYPVWSADSLWLAFTQTSGGTRSIWVDNLVTKQVRQVATQADPADVDAVAARLAWLPNPLHPTLTWATRDGTTITGLFSANVGTGASPQRLTSASLRFSAADYTQAAGGGVWLAASAEPAPTLSAISAQASGLMQSAPVVGAVSQIVWSPTGTAAAYVTADGQLYQWTPNGDTRLAGSVRSAPVWSPDGTRLAVQTDASIVSIRLQATAPTTQLLASSTGPATLSWAPDGRALLIAAPAGVTRVSSDGASRSTVDTQPAAGVEIRWTIAG